MESTLTEKELKLEAHRLRVAFNKKGIKHIWDFVQAFHPNKYEKSEFQDFISGRVADENFINVLNQILNRI